MEKELRIGHGYDVHRLRRGLRLRLGGVDIPYRKGCVAHSDGDVPVHALCDALLGAASLGDIGKHFPDSSPEYSGIDSLLLLERVAAMLKRDGWEIVNADITVQAQAPKLAPHIEAMREAIAAAAGVDPKRISVKATTTEKLGFVGRGKGIAAEAAALLSRAGQQA